jgi:hypothetical protein
MKVLKSTRGIRIAYTKRVTEKWHRRMPYKAKPAKPLERRSIPGICACGLRFRKSREAENKINDVIDAERERALPQNESMVLRDKKAARAVCYSSL